MSVVAPSIPDRPIVGVWPRWRGSVSVAAIERAALIAFVSMAAFLRVAAIFRYRIDSDEPQHLHVVWGWAHGLLQYRDLFDNHMPLFHILFAPLLRLVGESAQTLLYMRVAMLPLYVAMIAVTYRIAASCYPRRVALWSTIIAALIPGFLLWSVEFRTDDLWALLWLLSIAILVRPPLTLARVASAGLVLGLAAAVSAKTTLLLLSLAAGAGVVFFVRAGAQAGTDRQRAGLQAAIFLIAVAIPPAMLAFYFAARGAWQPFFYGVITHNVVTRFRVSRVIAFPGLLAVIGYFARRIYLTSQSIFRLFLFITAHFYAAALFCLWPLVEHEHWLPYYPLAAVTLVPLLVIHGGHALRRLLALAAIEIILVIGFGHLWRDETRRGLAVIEQTLQLTRPGETVMDLKGETVFRQRAFYYVLEPLTKHRIRSGRLRDTIIADILRTRTMVVALDHYGFPRAARAFLAKNFVPVGAVRVPGQSLRSGQNSFLIRVPAEYAVMEAGGTFDGLLDGRAYDAPRFLTEGIHNIEPAEATHRSLAIVWARAAEKGMSPFVKPVRTHGCKPSHAPRRMYHHKEEWSTGFR